MTKADMVEFVNSYLKPLGFQRKDKTWYKENPETITVFALQRSRWGDIYYANLCVNFRGLSEEKRPKFYKCHSCIRAENFGENTVEYLDLEKDIDENIRKQRIEQLLDKSLSILNKMATEAGFKEQLKEFNPRLFRPYTEAQKYLGIHID